MGKSLFFTEKFFEDLNENKENVLYSKDKVIIRGDTTILLIPAFLFKSKTRSFALEENDVIKRNYNVAESIIKIDSNYYEIKKGFLGKKDLSLINVLLKEHKVLLETVGLIQVELSLDNCDCDELNSLLNILFTQLLEHLRKEDLYLYKNYLKREALVDIINLYKDSMKLISKTAVSYYEKWKNNINLSNLKEFRSETEGIFKVLGERIINEEENFFPELLK